MAEGTSADDGEPVGWAHGQPVPRRDVDAYLGALSGTPVAARLGLGIQSVPGGYRHDAVRKWATKALLVDRLLSIEADRLGLTGQWAPEAWASRLEATGEITVLAPTEAELMACYRSNPSRFAAPEARRARHVLLADADQAAHLAGHGPVTPYDPAGFARLASCISADEGSRARGGDLGWVERGTLSGPLEDALFNCPAGHACGPVETAFGWHLLAVDDARPAGVLPFAECRAGIEAEMVHDRRWTAWREWLDRRIAAAIEVPPGVEHPAVRGLPGTPHRH